MGMNLFRQWYFRQFVLGLIVLLLGCSPGTKERPGPPAVPVTVAPVIQKTVPVQLRTIGNVQAYSTVSVKSLVAGELIRVYFIEGQDVKKGDLLFTIDPRPFEATVRQAEANLAKDLALVKEAEANLAKAISQVKEVEATLAKDMAQQKYAQLESQRYEELFKRGVVAKEQYDKVRLDTETIQATIEADRAAVDNAEEAVGAAKAAVETAKESVLTDRAVLENATIQLGYCSIRSPLSGRTGNLIVQQGNIVKANDTPFLVVINQINPINVTFSGKNQG
jgi:multidrug efflux system membrane fusion protein